MKVKKINLSWITVSDLAKSKKFFEEVGLKVSGGSEEYNWLELQGYEGGAFLGVGKSGAECSITPGQNAVVTFSVEDIVSAKAELVAKNVKFHGDIMEVPGHVKLATFSDPDNNIFQLVELISEKNK